MHREALSKRLASVAIGQGEATDASVSARNETVADLGNCQDRNGNQRRPEIDTILAEFICPLLIVLRFTLPAHDNRLRPAEVPRNCVSRCLSKTPQDVDVIDSSW